MGKNRTSNNSNLTSSTLLGNRLQNIKDVQKSIFGMDEDELKQLANTLKNSVLHYLKKGDDRTQYYKLSDGTIIPRYPNTVNGTKLLEDYNGDTYQNEYYRMLRDLLNDVGFELYMNGIDYEIEGNPLPDSVVPVIVY